MKRKNSEMPDAAGEYCAFVDCSLRAPCVVHVQGANSNGVTATSANDGKGDDAPESPPTLERRDSQLQDNGEEARDFTADPEKEKKLIKEKITFTVIPSVTYYLISQTWYRQWAEYVNFDSDENHAPDKWQRPQAIDNTQLVLSPDSVRLKQSVREGVDFVILPKDAWDLLKKWYGGGPELGREAVEYGGRAVVELWGLNLVIWRSSSPAAPVLFLNMSAKARVAKLKVKAAQALGLEPLKIQMWDYFQKSPYKLFTQKDLNATLENSQITEGNDIMIEEPVDGKFVMKKSGSNGLDMSGNVVTSSSRPLCRGVVGLQNLGNTCFMNSTLQCISNVPAVRDFFVNKQHEAEVNRDNPLGHSGKLADTFAQLLQLMWPTDPSVNVSAVAPRDFKYQIGTFAPQFAGYLQHDSSELMQFLLDGLHEDLNRVRTKPYVSNPESNNRPDAEVAAEFLEVYKKRNNSKIVDLFCGQFKTTLVCPNADCKNIAVLFEPYFSVPMPLLSLKNEAKSRYTMTIVRRGGQEEKATVMVEKLQKAGALFDAITQVSGLERANMVVCEFSRHDCLQTVFTEWRSLEFVRTNTPLYAYEVEDASVFLKERDEVVGKFKIGMRCECLYQGQWYVGAVTHAFPTHNGVAYSFRYDVDGLCSNNLKEEKLRFLPGTEPKEEDTKDEKSGVMCYFYPSGTPRLLVLPLTCSEAQVCNSVAQELGVTIDDFTATVVGQYGSTYSSQEGGALSPLKDAPVRLKQRLYLAINWKNGDPRTKKAEITQEGTKEEEKDSGVFDLTKSFKMFQEVETLSAQDMWYCNKCKTHVQAEKKMELWTTPPVLILQLKRFSYTRYNRDKLEDFVQFPLEGLDMRPFLLGEQKESVYDLAAVSNHHGNLGGGHYTAYGRSSEDGQWYKFDDESTRVVNKENVITDSAYILYYIRRDCRPASWA